MGSKDDVQDDGGHLGRTIRHAAQRFVSFVVSRSWAFWLFSFCLAHLLLQSWLVIDPDLFARMAVAKLVLSTGTIPETDPFAWTERLPRWIDHEWLSGFVFLSVYERFGDWGLYVLKLLIVATTATILRAAYAISRPFSGVGLAAIALVIFASSFLWFSTVRCQAFTYLLFAWTLYAIERYWHAGVKWPLVSVVCVMPAWTNLHGGFTLGIVVVGLSLLGEILQVRTGSLQRVRFLNLNKELMCGATLLNPYGFDLLWFVAGALAKSRDMIGEWSSVAPFSHRGAVLTAALFLYVWSVVKRGKSVRVSELLILVFCFWCGFRHYRLMPLALFVTVTTQAEAIEALVDRWRKQLHIVGLHTTLPLLAVVCAGGGALFSTKLLWSGAPWSRGGFTLDYSPYPVAAIDWALTNLPPGRMLTPFEEGNYVLWRGYPHFTVSIDGRYEEVYLEETFRRNMAMYRPSEPDRFGLINGWAPDFVLLPRALDIGSEEAASRWRTAYEDRNWRILTRGDSSDRVEQ